MSEIPDVGDALMEVVKWLDGKKEDAMVVEFKNGKTLYIKLLKDGELDELSK